MQPSADFGIVIGTVTELGTRRPLPYAMVTLQHPTTTVPKIASAVVQTTSNADAGFLLRTRAPATYTLAVYRVGYLPHIRSLEVAAGAVDTVHVELQFQRCTGY